MIKKEKLGQNFLINQKDINEFVNFCDIGSSDIVLEIGIGEGALTKPIAKQAKKVIGIDIDLKIIQIVNSMKIRACAGRENLKIEHLNILELDLSKIIKEESITKIVSAIPYYITSPIIHKIIKESCLPLKGAYLITQLEFAQKLIGEGGKRSYFTNLVEKYAGITKGKIIKASSFNPAPKVDSFYFSLVFNNYPSSFKEFLEWSKFLHHTFKTPRKMINKKFDKDLLKKLGIDTTLRPENLSLEQIEKLKKEFTG